MFKIIRRYIQNIEEINELIELLFTFDKINVIDDYMDSFVSNISEELLWISRKTYFFISSIYRIIYLYMEDYYIKRRRFQIQLKTDLKNTT